MGWMQGGDNLEQGQKKKAAKVEYKQNLIKSL